MRNKHFGLYIVFLFAWVLWANESSHMANAWRVFSGHTSLNECKREVPSRLSKLLKLDGAERTATDEIYLSKPTDRYFGQTTLRLVCLPDAVDPREKK